MPGVLHKPVLIPPTRGTRVVSDDPRVEELEIDLPEDETIALALVMCPEGEHIEIHAPECEVLDCTCSPRVIRKGAPS